jgi:hypothetical protein
MYRVPVLLCLLGLFAVACSDEGEAPFEGDGKVITKGSPRSMATANGDIFFANEVDGDPVISRLNTADGTVTQVVGPLDAKVSQVVTDGQWLAWVESEEVATGTVRYMQLPDGVTQDVMEDLESPTLALHNETLFGVEGAEGSVFSMPLSGGLPSSLAQDVKAVRAMATDGEFLYLAQAFDAPGGRIVRVPVTPGPHAPETIAQGLGTPLAILLTNDSVCWREFQGGLLQCAPKAGGTARILGLNHGFLAVSGPKFVADATSIFFATNHDIQRISLSGGMSQVVARLTSLSFVQAILLVGDTLYFTDGSALRSIAKNTVIAPENSTPNNIPSGPGCPSVFDGTYIGQFEYEYEEGDPMDPPLTRRQEAVQVTIELECITDFQGMATLNVTHVTASHPFFGCQVGGCTPVSPSIAILPSELPVSIGSPVGSGVQIRFPNGTSLGTANGEGGLSISSDGRTISSSLDPAFENGTWVACCNGFPPEAVYGTKYKSWILTKSAL